MFYIKRREAFESIQKFGMVFDSEIALVFALDFPKKIFSCKLTVTPIKRKPFLYDRSNLSGKVNDYSKLSKLW
jgi:hypothetical protein